MSRLAKFVSLVLHPLWMPIAIYGAASWLIPFAFMGWQEHRFVLMLLLVNAVAPALSILLMRRHGLISSIELHSRAERSLPFLLVVFYYLVGWALLQWLTPGIVVLVPNMFLAVGCSLIPAMLINLRWKISVHMIAQGGLLGSVLAIGELYAAQIAPALLLSFALSIITAWARIKLKVHDEQQTYAGWLLGAIINYAVLVYG